MIQPTTLNEYLERYGGLLASQAKEQAAPLQHFGEDDLPIAHLLRQPIRTQRDVIAAGAKALCRQRGIVLSCQMGTGKTYLSQAIVESHEHGKPYRCLVMCPPHLVDKWKREIQMTIPKAGVVILEDYRQLTRCRRWVKPIRTTWWIMSTSKAKLGPGWKAASTPRRVTKIAGRLTKCQSPRIVHCPDCNATVPKTLVKGYVSLSTIADLEKERRTCPECGGALYQWQHKPDRWPLATFIHRRLKGFFRYFVADESHQAKSDETAAGLAFGSLAAACDKTICLTGTLLGGYAWHVRPLMFRIAPQSLVTEGLEWKGEGAFNERYGRFEKIVHETRGGGVSHRQSRGKATTSTARYVRPGVMPTLYARHLIGNTIFLDLDQVGQDLPPLTHHLRGVPMDPDLEEAYRYVEGSIKGALQAMGRRKNRALVSTMLHTLMSYPDHPYGWKEIGYCDDEGAWVHVCDPPNLPDRVRGKEQMLLDYVQEQGRQQRKAWVYYTYTEKPPVGDRLARLLGPTCGHLKSNVETRHREQWIIANGPKYAAMLSHPQLVETGLDFFDHAGTYNFPSIVFYETGYNLFTVMQAAGRAWRIGQKQPCETSFLYWEGTMQEKCVRLMGRKQQASKAVEGKFSAEGLAAMLDGHDSLEMELAASLADMIEQ